MALSGYARPIKEPFKRRPVLLSILVSPRMGAGVIEMIRRKQLQASLVGLSFLFLGGAGAAWAQTRVDNPARPLAKNAGRIVKLEEVVRIRDDGESAVFRSPQDLTLGTDGSLYFLDFAEGDRLYRYSLRASSSSRP